MNSQQHTMGTTSTSTSPGIIGTMLNWIKFIIAAFALWVFSLTLHYVAIKPLVEGTGGEMAIFAVWVLGTALATHMLGWRY